MYEKKLVKNLKTKNFSISIDRALLDQTPIEVAREQTSKTWKILIDRKTYLIDRKF